MSTNRQRCNTHKQEKKGCKYSKKIASTVHVVLALYYIMYLQNYKISKLVESDHL
jgi:hypothetical protein